jgi:hypothetical protein
LILIVLIPYQVVYPSSCNDDRLTYARCAGSGLSLCPFLSEFFETACEAETVQNPA